MNRIKRECAASDHFIITRTSAPQLKLAERGNDLGGAVPSPYVSIARAIEGSIYNGLKPKPGGALCLNDEEDEDEDFYPFC